MRVQSYLGSLYQHFCFMLTKYAKNVMGAMRNPTPYDRTRPSAFVPQAVDPILTNSFMDLCVRFNSPQMALGLFNRLHQVLAGVSGQGNEPAPVKDHMR